MLKTIFLVLSLFAIFIIPVSAEDGNNELNNVSFISDIGQIIASDALTLVDGNQLEINGNPYRMDFFWSPDGTRVLVLAALQVYPKGQVNTDKKGSVIVLYLMNGDGSGLTRISWGGDTLGTKQQYKVKFVRHPEWGPSGDVFSYTEQSKEHVTYGEFPDIFLYVINVKNLKIIAEKKIAPIQPIIEWSPKEDKLLYLGLDDLYRPSVFIFDVAKNIAEKSPANEYKTRSQFTDGDFVWSPDGKKIGFIGKSGIFVLYVDTNEIRNIFSTDNSITFYKASWSPDSSKIIMSEIKSSSYSHDDALYEVYVNDMNSGQSKKLTTFEGSGSVEGWFPDSKSFLYKSFYYGSKTNYRLYLASVNGNDKKTLFLSSDSFDASISPSGEFLGIVQGIIINRNEFDKFILLNKDGSIKLQQTIKKGGFSWKGSDDLLLETVNEDQSNSLVIMNVPTNETKQIPIKDSSIDKVSWSPGGRYLIVNSNILELANYEIPMRFEVTGQPLTNNVINISVRSASGGVDGASVTVNSQQIGITNEKGLISYQLSGMDEILIGASKNGYSITQKTIKITDLQEVQYDKTDKSGQTSVSAQDSTELPGFSALCAFITLLSSSFLLTMNRKLSEVDILDK